MESKICTKCNQLKSLEEFHKHKKGPLGVNSQCIECRKEGKRIHYQNNKEKYKEAYQRFIERKKV